MSTNPSNNNTPHTLGFVAIAIVGYGLFERVPWAKIFEFIRMCLIFVFVALFAGVFLWNLIRWGIEIYAELKENRAWIEETKSKTIPDFESQIRNLNHDLWGQHKAFDVLSDEKKKLNAIIEALKIRYRISDKTIEDITEKIRKENEPEELPPAESIHDDPDAFEEGEWQ